MVQEKYIVSCTAGKEDYELEDGSVDFLGEDLMDLDPEERHKGVFLSFQYPIEIPGISVSNFIKTSLQKKKNSRSRPTSQKIY